MKFLDLMLKNPYSNIAIQSIVTIGLIGMMLFHNHPDYFHDKTVTLKQHWLIASKLKRPIQWKMTKNQACSWIGAKIWGVAGLIALVNVKFRTKKSVLLACACIYLPTMTCSFLANFHWPKGRQLDNYLWYIKKKEVVVYIEACHDLLQISKKASKYLEYDNFKQVVGLYESYRNLYFKILHTYRVDNDPAGYNFDVHNEPCYFKNLRLAFQVCKAAFETLPNEVVKDIDFLLPDLKNIVYEYLFDYSNLKISKYPRESFIQCSEILLECIENFGDLYKVFDD